MRPALRALSFLMPGGAKEVGRVSQAEALGRLVAAE